VIASKALAFKMSGRQSKAAREELGYKAKKNLMFITLVDNGVWSWLHASPDEYCAKSKEN
jgi:hypothetical protein